MSVDIYNFETASDDTESAIRKFQDSLLDKLAPTKGISDVDEAELRWAFPDVDPGAVPFGGRVLLQVRRVRKKSAGGLVLVSETQEVEKWNTQVAKVIAVGPLAYKNKNDLTPWPEGVWASVGDFVRSPKYGGDRWHVDIEGEDEPALFMICNDTELIARVTGSPLRAKAYL